MDQRPSKPLGVPELRFVGDVQRLELHPGDTVVISAASVLSPDTVTRIKEAVRAAIGSEYPILVFGDGLKIGVLSPQ